MRRLQTLLCLLVLSTAGAGAAERLVVEVIPIGYRSVEELLPVVRPLVPPPGSVSGAQGHLVVKTTPENLSELKRVLAELDRAPRTLLVSVRQGASETSRARKDEARVRIEHGDVTGSAGSAGGGGGLTARIEGDDVQARVHSFEAESESSDSSVQRVRVMEGREAFIETGQSVPFSSREVIISGGSAHVRESVEFRDVTRGFYVVPRVRGDRVLVQVSPHSARLNPSGSVDVQAAATTVSGPVGQWIPIGGVDESGRRSDTGVLQRAESESASQHLLYIKVDVLSR